VTDVAAEAGELPWMLSARALAQRIAQGELSAREAMEAHISRIEEVNPALNAVVWKRYEQAREEAGEVDRRRARGDVLGALAGVPITIKECLDLTGSPSTFGVPARKTHRAERDDEYVSRLRAAGAIVLGKTNAAQCLLFVESDNPLYGRSNHPEDIERSPGGSSGGQAAIVAAGGSPLGLGTDIGGSNRVPAAFCGIVGLKPTAGRTPDPGRGSIPIGQLAVVSQVGVFARSVDDAALGLQIVAPFEGTAPLRDFRHVEMAKLRIGYFIQDGVFEPSAAYWRATKEAVEALGRLGARTVELKAPSPREAFEIFYRLLCADRMAGLRRFLGDSPRVKQIEQLERLARTPVPLLPVVRFLLRLSGRRKTSEVVECFGRYSADAYWTACERQLDYRARWLRTLDEQGVDAVLSPATALPAVRHGATLELGLIGAYACLYNVLGWPAGVVPVTRVRADEETATARGKDVSDRTALETEKGSAGLPIAVQIAARPWREDLVLGVMAALEQVSSFRMR